MSCINTKDSRILNVLVVGFHHKKGCQIEYCYPPLKSSENETNSGTASPNGRLPSIWKTLPSLALPDGAHNYEKDTIYFTLPHPWKSNSTVFGVSCYRQIPAEKLTIKTEDVTRDTVQKSVVVLSELPLFGLISCKCEMITSVYFNEFDFSKIDCLIELYDNLCCCVNTDLLCTSEAFIGLNSRDLLISFQHRILVLFKLILLEKKVLFYKTPVSSLCTTILTLVSLYPGMVEKDGLKNASSSVQPKAANERKFSVDIELVDPEPESELVQLNTVYESSCSQPNEVVHVAHEGVLARGDDDDGAGDEKVEDENENKDENGEAKLPSRPSTPPLMKIPLEDCGFPLEIFKKGSFCHPYLSLTYLDVLNDVRVRSFVIGATNYLFKQKKSLFDVIVDESSIQFNDLELKKQTDLSTEDLRFADYLVKNTIEIGKAGKELNGISWEGGDEWLRYQFKVYLLHALRSSECNENSKEYQSFNPQFMNAWKETHNYKAWSSISRPGVFEVNPGHPFHGQLNISDMKLKLSHAVFQTERGKKINQQVTQTGKAVGSAISSAKVAVSSWWSQWNSPKTNEEKKSGGVHSDDVSPAQVASSLSSISLSSLLQAEAENEILDLEPNLTDK